MSSSLKPARDVHERIQAFEGRANLGIQQFGLSHAPPLRLPGCEDLKSKEGLPALDGHLGEHFGGVVLEAALAQGRVLLALAQPLV